MDLLDVTFSTSNQPVGVRLKMVEQDAFLFFSHGTIKKPKKNQQQTPPPHFLTSRTPQSDEKQPSVLRLSAVSDRY